MVGSPSWRSRLSGPGTVALRPDLRLGDAAESQQSLAGRGRGGEMGTGPREPCGTMVQFVAHSIHWPLVG